MMSKTVVPLFEKPYYAVIFSSQKNADDEGYGEMAMKMAELARQQKGFLGVESFRNGDGGSVTISYWKSLEDIRAWKAVSEHREAQATGRERWYDSFTVRICKVERDYRFP